jgi:hypothetical protein
MRRVLIWLLCICSTSLLLSTEQEVPEEIIQDQTYNDSQAESEQPLVLVDTDDLSEPQGNWLFKRHWLKRANKIYDQITTLVNEIFDLRGRFMNERSALDQDLFDPFYLRIGITQGELRALISYLIEQLEREDVKEVADKERLLVGKLKDQEEVIFELNDDIKAIGAIDQEVDTTITTLFEQLNLVRSYQQQAWEALKAIERELSDQRARDLVFEMRALQKNIKDIKLYLEGSFTEFFDSLISRARQEVDRLQVLIHSLKEKGIDLKFEAQELELIEGDASKDQPRTTQGIFSRLWAWLKGLFS